MIDTGEPRYLIAKADPITFAADQIGWCAVHINANDIATKGARRSPHLLGKFNSGRGHD